MRAADGAPVSLVGPQRLLVVPVQFPDVTPRRSVVGAHTEPGTGYGMIAYAANPGMLTGVRRGRVDLDRIALPGGGTYAGGVVVSAENARATSSTTCCRGAARDRARRAPASRRDDARPRAGGGAGRTTAVAASRRRRPAASGAARCRAR
ncbi:MAG: hypothetical protein HYS37_13130, partial [Candidatus Rokubacteria bacterium]|nr:hypothetical protein [Candidatus Rokubacteria bacterium]